MLRPAGCEGQRSLIGFPWADPPPPPIPFTAALAPYTDAHVIVSLHCVVLSVFAHGVLSQVKRDDESNSTVTSRSYFSILVPPLVLGVHGAQDPRILKSFTWSLLCS